MINNEFKSWIFYKPGSYWIYLNNQTGKKDSIYITNFENKVNYHEGPYSGYVSYYWEYANIEFSGNIYYNFRLQGAEYYAGTGDFIDGVSNAMIQLDPSLYYYGNNAVYITSESI